MGECEIASQEILFEPFNIPARKHRQLDFDAFLCVYFFHLRSLNFFLSDMSLKRILFKTQIKKSNRNPNKKIIII